MRKSWMTLGVLLAAVVALGLFVWLKPPKPPAVTYAMSSLKFNDARTVRVLRKGKPLVTLEKRGAEWLITEPIKAPADEFQVQRLLAVLDAKSVVQFPSTDLAKFELDAPQTEIIVNDQRFAFGAINAVTRDQYVLTQNVIVPVELRFGAGVPADANALLRRSVLAPGDTPLRFEFGAFTVENDGKKWNTTPPAADVSQDDYNRWVAQWREGSALRTDIADKRKPAGEIHITLKSGGKVALGILQTEPELIVRRADLDLQFVFVNDIGKQMMVPPGPRK